MVRVPTHRAPTNPGEMLLEEFLKPLGLTQVELAARIGVSYPRVNELVHGKRAMTPNPFIERTSQRPLRALCAAAHVER